MKGMIDWSSKVAQNIKKTAATKVQVPFTRMRIGNRFSK